MHPEAYEYVDDLVRSLPPRVKVLEVGSRVVYGTVRPVFAGVPHYVGLDVRPGEGVTEVGDGSSWSPTDGKTFDTVVCCEVLEHTEKAGDIVRHALDLLDEGGYFIMTCAGPRRGPHSAVTGTALLPGEFYRNVTLEDVKEWSAGYSESHWEYGRQDHDLYGWARK